MSRKCGIPGDGLGEVAGTRKLVLSPGCYTSCTLYSQGDLLYFTQSAMTLEKSNLWFPKIRCVFYLGERGGEGGGVVCEKIL